MRDSDYHHLFRVALLLFIAVSLVYLPFIIETKDANKVINTFKKSISPNTQSQGTGSLPNVDQEGTPIPQPVPAPDYDQGSDDDYDDHDDYYDDYDDNEEDNGDDNSGGTFGNDVYFLESDFETGSLSDHWNTHFARSDSAEIVSDVVRNGNYAIKMNVRKGDIAIPNDAENGKSRVELSLKSPYADEYPMDGTPVFYGWSVYFPEDYYFNHSIEHDGFNIVGQWFHRPEPGQSWEEWDNEHGGKRGSPSVSIRYEELEDGTHGLGILTRPNVESISSVIGEREIQLGEWNDIIFEVKWSMNNDGYIKAWLNGAPFTTTKHYAKNMYTSTPKKLKLGMYRGPNVLSENNIYYDEIRIGGSYEEVDPSNY